MNQFKLVIYRFKPAYNGSISNQFSTQASP